MENKYVQIACKVGFMAVAVLMYYFLTEVINLGLFVTFRHAFALALFVLAFFAFLYKPNIARGAASLTSTFVYSSPLLITMLLLISIVLC